MRDKIIIYTDGGSRGNGSADCISAWAYTLEYNGKTKHDKGSQIGATNNQMEMMAIIKALSAISNKTIPVVLHSDSQLCIKGVNEWMDGWKKKNWKNSKKQVVENKELWVEIDNLVSQFKDIEFVKVKGHSNVHGNILVDKLVNDAMDELIAKNQSNGSTKKQELNPIRTIELDGGKYVLTLNEEDCKFECLRHGEKWRDLTGDNMTLALFQEIERLKEEINKRC